MFGIRPFRFAVQAINVAGAREWHDTARKVEDLGYSTLFLADHYLGPGAAQQAAHTPQQGLAPIAAMATAAAVTETVLAPMFHAWGFSQLVISATLACPIVTSGKFDPQATLEPIDRHRATGLAVVPLMFDRIMELPEDVRKRCNCRPLRFAVASGSRMRPDVVTAFTDEFGDVTFDNDNATKVGMIATATRQTCAPLQTPPENRPRAPTSRAGATEPRLAKVELPAEAHRTLNEAFAEATSGTEEEARERLKTRWSRVDAIMSSDKRIGELAADIVQHREHRREVLAGKGLIVAMSRRIAVALYNEIVRLRPGWHSDDSAQGRVKVVVTGSAADDAPLQPHIYPRRRCGR